MTLTATAERLIEAPREQVFDDLVANETYPRILHPAWPIPGIRSAEFREGDSPVPGAWRTITLTDGSAINEQILELERPRIHRYAWSEGLRFPLSTLIRRAEATWTFSETASQTRVCWLYAFELTSPLAWPAARLLIWRFQSWMVSGLARAQDRLEQATA